jgi:hypothetical protein
MTRSITELDLSGSALPWIESRLSNTLHLANFIWRKVRAGQGRVVVPWPSDLNVEFSLHFDSGGIFRNIKASGFSPINWLGDQLKRHLCQESTYVGVQQLYIECDLYVPSGAFEKYMSNSNYSYYVCRNPTDLGDFLSSFMLSGIGQHCLIIAAVGSDLGPKFNISAAFVPIYDGESFARITFGEFRGHNT